MPVINHAEQRQNKSYLSKITGRQIMNPRMGSANSVLWEQFMTAGGFIPPTITKRRRFSLSSLVKSRSFRRSSRSRRSGSPC